MTCHIVGMVTLRHWYQFTIIRQQKWFFVELFKAPKVKNALLNDSIDNVLKSTQGDMQSTFIIGDININVKTHSEILSMCEI